MRPRWRAANRRGSPPGPETPDRRVSDALRGTLIGGLFALLGALVGSAGSLYVERQEHTEESQRTARGVARVIQDELLRRAEPLGDYQAVVADLRPVKDKAERDRRKAGYRTAVIADMPRIVGPLPLSLDDRKLLAVELTPRQWAAVSRVTVEMASLQSEWRTRRTLAKSVRELSLADV